MSESSPPIKLLLVDDHAVVREGLSGLLSTAPDIEVVGSVASGREALAFCNHNPVDVVLLDLMMPGLDGHQTLVALLAARPDQRVLMLSSHDGDEAIYRALKAGAVGYLLKDCQPSELLQSVRDARGDKVKLSAAVNERLAQRTFMESLNAREVTILERIAQGESNREIAQALGLSEGTVKNYVMGILTKLGASDRTHAVTTALQRGIIRLQR